MKLVFIFVLCFFNLSSFAQDFSCSAKVLENGQAFSVIDIDAYWSSSTKYENINLALPEGVKTVYVDMDIDGRVLNEPKITFKVKESKGKKAVKEFVIKKFGKSRKHKLDKKHAIEFTCG